MTHASPSPRSAEAAGQAGNERRPAPRRLARLAGPASPASPALPARQALPARPPLPPLPSLPLLPSIIALLVAAALAAAPVAAASIWDEGERVPISGVVSDAGGRPLPGVRVVFEAVRRTFSLREMHRTEKDVRRISTVTNARGEYNFQWPWDSYFNRFALLAGIDVRHARQEKMEILERQDVTERMESGDAVVVPILVHNRALVDHVQDFVASVQSADERRIYDEMGTPDDVKRVAYAGSDQQGEVSWWYFDAGRVYRFRDGRLDQVERFDPVRRF